MSFQKQSVFLGDDNLHAIVIPAARVDNVNVAPGALVLGPPGPTSFLGLAHKMGLDVAASGVAGQAIVEFVSAALIVHEFEVAPGHRRIPPERRGEHGNLAGAMIDDPEGSLLCSIVLCVRTDSKVAFDAAAVLLGRNLLRYRLAGGRIISAGTTSGRGCSGAEVSRALNPVEIAWTQDDLLRILRVLPPGAALLDRTHLLDPDDDAPDQRDALDRLLDKIAVRQVPLAGEEGEGDEGDEPDLGKPKRFRWTREKGWLVPLHIGWRALSDIEHRPGMRAGEGVIGHAWAEDVLGLGEWEATRKVFRRDGCKGDAMWRYADAEPEGPYLTEGTP